MRLIIAVIIFMGFTLQPLYCERTQDGSGYVSPAQFESFYYAGQDPLVEGRIYKKMEDCAKRFDSKEDRFRCIYGLYD